MGKEMSFGFESLKGYEEDAFEEKAKTYLATLIKEGVVKVVDQELFNKRNDLEAVHKVLEERLKNGEWEICQSNAVGAIVLEMIEDKDSIELPYLSVALEDWNENQDIIQDTKSMKCIWNSVYADAFDCFYQYSESVADFTRSILLELKEQEKEKNQPPKVKIGIYQLRHDDENLTRRFADLKQLKRYGEVPKSEYYELIYVGYRDFVRAFSEDSLEKIYASLNDGSPHPRNYYGYSLSVGDVVVVSKGDEFPQSEEPGECYFVDSIGFKEIHDFFDDQDCDHAKDRFFRAIDVCVERDCVEEINETIEMGTFKDWAWPEWMLETEYLEERGTILEEYAVAISMAESRGKLDEAMKQAQHINQVQAKTEEEDKTKDCLGR